MKVMDWECRNGEKWRDSGYMLVGYEGKGEIKDPAAVKTGGQTCILVGITPWMLLMYRDTRSQSALNSM